MIDGTAIEKIEALVKQSLTSQEAYGIEYDRKTWKPVEPPSHETALQLWSAKASAPSGSFGHGGASTKSSRLAAGISSGFERRRIPSRCRCTPSSTLRGR